MLKPVFVLPLLAFATACAVVPGATVDPAARRAAMQALPDQATCQPAEPEGARNCTMRLGTKQVRVNQFRNLTTIRYAEADTAEPAFINDLRRVMTTAGTPAIDRAMTVVTSHGRSGVMEDFTSGCFAPEGAPTPAAAPAAGAPAAGNRECFVALSY